MTTIEQLRAALSSQHLDEQLTNGETIFINTRAYREATVPNREPTVDKCPNQPSDHAELYRHPNDSLLP